MMVQAAFPEIPIDDILTLSVSIFSDSTQVSRLSSKSYNGLLIPINNICGALKIPGHCIPGNCIPGQNVGSFRDDIHHDIFCKLSGAAFMEYWENVAAASTKKLMKSLTD